METGQDDGILRKLQEGMPGFSEEAYEVLMTYMAWVEYPSTRYVARMRMMSEDDVWRQLRMVEELPSDLLNLFERVLVDLENAEGVDDCSDLKEVEGVVFEERANSGGMQNRGRGLALRVAAIRDRVAMMKQDCPGITNKEIAGRLGVSKNTLTMASNSLVWDKKDGGRNIIRWECVERDEQVLHILLSAGRWVTIREIAARLKQPYTSIDESIKRLAAEGRLPALPKNSMTEDEEMTVVMLIAECRRRKMKTAEILKMVMEMEVIEHEVKLCDLAKLFGVSRERMRQLYNKCEEKGWGGLLSVNRHVSNKGK